MWLIVSLLAATLVTAIHILAENSRRYRLDWLSLMLWGLVAMVLVDHVIGFITEGGEFIEVTTDGYIENSALLGMVMLMPIFALWGAMVVIHRTWIHKAGGG
ncbi:MAG: hypothetical protein ACUVQ0_05390 [Thermoproteota archaeon]